MGRIVLVYGSAEGQTSKIAGFIADVLAGEGHNVELVDSHHLAPDFRLGAFDGALIGASVHQGKHDKRVVEFVRANLDALENVPSAFFSVSLTAAGSTEQDRMAVERLLEQFSERTGWRPEKPGVFAGALVYSKYNPVIRFVMKTISRSHGGDTDTSHDYEYTDWDGVARFARKFLDTLRT